MPVVRALIVHEPLCPAAGEVVAAIAAGLAARGAAVGLLDPAAVRPDVAGPVDLLVVAAAADPVPGQPAPFVPTIGLPVAGGVREWIERVDLAHGQPTATFDVRVRSGGRGPGGPGPGPRLPGAPGSPARAAARRLRERGATIVGTRSFTGPGPGGRLDDAERGLVRDWTAGLVVEAAIHRVG